MNVGSIVSIARWLDALVAVICLTLAGYFFLEEAWGWATFWGAAGAVSVVAAWLKPAKWIAKKIMLARLRS